MRSLGSIAVGSTFDFPGKGVRIVVFFVDKLISSISIKLIASVDTWMNVLYFVMLIALLLLFILNSKPAADPMMES